MGEIAFKPLFESNDAGIPAVDPQVTQAKQELKNISGSRGGGVAAGSTTLYTVPAGKVLFLTYASISFSGGGAGAIGILQAGSMLIFSLYDTGATYPSQNIVFPNPLPVFAGETIYINKDTAASGISGYCSGFLVDA